MCNEACIWMNRVYAAMDQGLLSPQAVAEMALQYLGENDVYDMVKANDLQDFLKVL